ncbi:MAG: ATP-binding protein [Proteobacteria bacterium]|nr:ATP-binding protein [Pseudomonadota bacterium]
MKCSNCNDTRIEVVPDGRFARAGFCQRCFQSCRECDGIGFIFEKDEFGREHARNCSCKEIQRRITLFNQAQIPSQFYDATFDNFNVSSNPSLKSALATAKFSFKNYENGNWKGLLFMGGVGVGKTRLVSTMLRNYTLKYGIPGLFQEFSSLLSEIKSGYDLGMSEVNVLEKINNVEILVVDELGKGRKSDWEIAILDTIISGRYNMRKTTIFTTNYTDKKATSYGETVSQKNGKNNPEGIEKRETLEQRVFSRIYSRLKGMCDFIEMKGADYRYPENEFSA